MVKINARRVAVAATLAILPVLGYGAQASADTPYELRPGAQSVVRQGLAADRAGGRADVEISFGVTGEDRNGFLDAPVQGTKEAVVDLPLGLVGDPTSLGTCSMDDVLSNEQVLYAGRCPREAAIGWAEIDAVYPAGNTFPKQRRRIWRVAAGPNEAAAFATSIAGLPVRMSATVSPSGGYRIAVTGDKLPQQQFVRGFTAHLWAVPADHQGPGSECDGFFQVATGDFRCADNTVPGAPTTREGLTFGAPLGERKPFMTNGSVCGKSLVASFWLQPFGHRPAVSEDVAAAPLTNCEDQPFDPSISVTPSSRSAGQPSGYDVTIDVPQTNDPDSVATAHVKDVSVDLPEGVAISPPSANGLDACSDAAFDVKGDAPAACPNASSIGTVTVETPLLEEPLTGKAFLGTQLSKDPMSGEMYRLFLQVQGPGVLVKLKGAVRANPQTGQLTTTFENNPQMPFDRILLQLDHGNRASLVNPKTCGTFKTSATLTSYAGHSRELSSSFVIDEGCSPGHFQPTFMAGTVNPLAGAFAPFDMTVNRNDADQDLSRLNLEMPSGLLAALGSVPLCGAAEANAGTCAAASRIGSTSVLVGSGGEPLPLTGQVFVTGPYKGAPFGLSVVVPAKVGPFDLGDVVVRGALHVDANRAKVTAVTDPFPEIVGGVPVRLRQVNVSMDRPGFMFNPTSCEQTHIHGAFWSTAGAPAARSVPFQAQGCDKLKLSPRIGLEWTGKTQMREGKHPGVKAKLGDMLGQANLKKVKVTLPLTAALDPANAKALCEPSAAAANNCPADSRVGWASASTPALHKRVQGPVYFVRGVRISETGREIRSLPKLYVPLSGQGVRVDLWADSDVDSKKRLVSTFREIPDVPVRDFELSINSGKGGILEATNDVCGASKTTTIEYTGHNDGVTVQRVKFTAPDCKPQIVSAENSRNVTLPVRVGGIGPGKLMLSGKGIGEATRKVVRSDAALVRAKLSRNARSHLRSGKSFRTRLTVRYAPTKGKAINIRKTVRIKPIER
jgi:hypothetical protein